MPVLYLPVFYYPIQDDDRATGFLLPIYGASTIRGQTLSNAFFWAINRSQDATFIHDWYSKTGQGFGGEYRYELGGGNRGNADVNLLNEHAADYQQPDGIGDEHRPASHSFLIARRRSSQALGARPARPRQRQLHLEPGGAAALPAGHPPDQQPHPQHRRQRHRQLVGVRRSARPPRRTTSSTTRTA